MKIGILGTGMVGQTIGTKLTELGHDVRMGSRTDMNPKAVAWASNAGEHASSGRFDEAAEFGEIIFNCTKGENTLEALRIAGADAIGDKVLIDVSNPLDFSHGMPPTLTVTNTDSLGEQIQRAYPKARVVKTLNSATAALMVKPALVAGMHDMFMSGNDPEAKALVRHILQDWFGWQSVIDLGDITNARAQEALMPIWIRLYGQFKSPYFNFHIARQSV